MRGEVIDCSFGSVQAPASERVYMHVHPRSLLSSPRPRRRLNQRPHHTASGLDGAGGTYHRRDSSTSCARLSPARTYTHRHTMQAVSNAARLSIYALTRPLPSGLDVVKRTTT